MSKKFCLAAAAAALLAASSPIPAEAVVYEITSAGKTAQAAESTARLDAVRQCMNGMITADKARTYALGIREHLFKKVKDITSIEVIESAEAGERVTMRSNVTVDENAVRAALAEIPELAAALPPVTSGQPAAQGGEEPAGGDQPAAQGGEGPAGGDAPAAQAMTDEDFLNLVRDSRSEDAAISAAIDAGANVNGTGERGDSALHGAVFANSAERVRLLLEKGAAVNAVNQKGETALLNACEDGADPDVVNALIEGKADVNLAAKERNGLTPLIAAVRDGNAAAADLLMDAGADVNAPAANGKTPLIVAVSEDAPAIVKMLLDKGADPNIADGKGFSPLAYAIRDDNVEMVRQLAAKGADLKAEIPYRKNEKLSAKDIVEKDGSDAMKAAVAALLQ